MATETKECEYCHAEYEGKRTQKYCGELCRDIMGLERKHQIGYVSSSMTPCTGNCCKQSTKNIRNTAQGWKFIKESSYAVKIGVLIDYCPFCGGRLT